ncbi:MAG TPA: LysR family transcriptional regulator [Pseudolabrys sp.]|nr:LysR family transcriptional regulator [Pseudolabrys sp.]
MTNIPTDLLRTLIAVVDLRSFTRAAQSLGVTQPAVSAQIKRLQFLLSCDLFDKSAPGIALTQKGEAVVAHARRLLAINDEILSLSEPQQGIRRIRIGTPGDLSGPLLPWTLAKFRLRWPDVSFHLRSGIPAAQLRDLANGEFDIVIAHALDPTVTARARHSWADHMVWCRSDVTKLDPQGPVPLVAFSEECLCYRTPMAALKQAGREGRLVLTAAGSLTLTAAVNSGLGVTAMMRSRVPFTNLTIWENPPLPPLPATYAGVFVPEGCEDPMLLELADELAPLLRPKPHEPSNERREYEALQRAFAKTANSA